jgi:hypothetical protein
MGTETTDVHSSNLSDPAAAGSYRLFASQFCGYNSHTNTPWHIDAQQLFQLINAHGGVTPGPLTISSDTLINSVRMSVTPDGQNTQELSQFGHKSGTVQTVTSGQLAMIDKIEFWGTTEADTPVLGQIKFTFKPNTIPPITCGSSPDVFLCAVSPPADETVLTGFVGVSGTYVDGLFPLFASREP